ncbi:MAG: hypothetical protein ACREMY_09510, partial [bacterium]
TRKGGSMSGKCRHTGYVVTKFNGGNPWVICGRCSVRICGKRLPTNERCVNPADHKGACKKRPTE